MSKDLANFCFKLLNVKICIGSKENHFYKLENKFKFPILFGVGVALVVVVVFKMTKVFFQFFESKLYKSLLWFCRKENGA
jgi:hypothetical protein